MDESQCWEKEARHKIVHTMQFSHLSKVLKQAKLMYWNRVHVILRRHRGFWGAGKILCLHPGIGSVYKKL